MVCPYCDGNNIQELYQKDDDGVFVHEGDFFCVDCEGKFS